METGQELSESAVLIGDKLAGKFLTFMLGAEEYALQILKVQEIIRLQEVTSIPQTPDFIRGVINLRGQVIPVIELTRKFKMNRHDDTEKTCIVVVQVTSLICEIVMGIIIDEVKEVRDFIPSEIDSSPSFGTSIDTTFIMGIGKLDERVIVLLDIDKVLTKDQIKSISNIK